MFEGQSKYLGENLEKYITSLVRIEKQENGETIKHKIKFKYSVRFIAGSLSSLTDKLAESLPKGKCSLEYMTLKDGLLTFKPVHCNQSYEKKFDRFVQEI